MKCIIFIIAFQSVFWFGRGQQSNVIRISEKARRLPQLDVCGKSNRPHGQRIINGRPAELGEYPWMAALGYLDDDYFIWGCGGSLITDQYVITAAHCLIPRLIEPFNLNTVRLGELNLDEAVADGATPLDFRISRWISHPEYKSTTKEYDIGLIKLNRKVTFTDHIKPICLPPPVLATNDYVGFITTIAGWGRSLNTTRQKTDTRLLEGEVVIRDREECRRNNTSRKQLKDVIIDQRVICASGDKVDSCQGDSGGPMMWYIRPDNAPPGTKGNTYLMGIVAYGYLCAVPGYPGVYTRVAMNMAWILENMDI